MRQTPPYAKGARAVAGCAWVRCGSRGWEHMRRNPDCGEMVYPTDKDPASFHWPVHGLGVYVVADEPISANVYKLVGELIACGAEDVTLIYEATCGLARYTAHTTIPPRRAN